MTEVIWFEKDGFTYAKGFSNQNGLTFYVLKGYKDLFEETLHRNIHPAIEYGLEELTEFPGGNRCPEAP